MQILGSKKDYHFVHKRSTHLRTRRDTSIMNDMITSEKGVKTIVQQHGFKRNKRGFRTSSELKEAYPDYNEPKDPFFKYQWYLVG